MSKKINATRFEDIPACSSKKKRKRKILHIVIETPKDSPHKYALKSNYGIIAFSEVLPEGMRWPFDYGFVPQTLAPDGDPLDVLVLTKQPLFPGCLIEARIVGAIKERKNCVETDRLIAVPLASPGAPATTDRYKDIGDVPTSKLKEITDFLVQYSQKAGNAIEISGVVDAATAMKTVKRTSTVFAKAERR